MIRLLRFLKGYVFFCASGGFPERFLNLCKINGINLWEVKNDGVKVYACTTGTDFQSLNLPAENSGMCLEIIKESGLIYFIKRHKWRCGAVVGILLTVVFWWLMSCFIWEVEVLVPEGVKAETFTEALSDLGVKTGALKSNIDIIDVQNKLLFEYPQLQWASLNIFGGKAQLETAFVNDVPEMFDTKTPINMVAAKAGTVTLVKGYYGVNTVKEGDTVAQGALLISGVGVNADGSEYFVHAKGEVYAKTKTVLEKTAKTQLDIQTTTDSVTVYGVYVFGLEIPLGIKKHGGSECKTPIYIKSGENSLPLGAIRTDYFSTHGKKCSLNEKEAFYSALLDCVKTKRSDFENVKTENITYFVRKSDTAVSVLFEIKCVENIAVEKSLQINEKSKEN